MESLAEPRACPEKLQLYNDDNDRFDMFLLADKTRYERPVHYNMTMEVFPDTHSEGVAESCFSTHAAFATDLHKTTAPVHVAMMVFCNRNHDLLFEQIEQKIQARYMAMYGRSI
jgi:hypothetical protein